MAEINIELLGVDEVSNRLKSIPSGSAFALKQAILFCLRKGRVFAAEAAKKRYNVAPKYLTAAIGQARMSGPLSAFIRVAGPRVPLSSFPHRDEFPGGVQVEELRSHATVLRHAFAKTAYGHVYERLDKTRRDLPIWRMAGLPVSQMVGQRTEVYPELKFRMEFELYSELDRLMRAILSGAVKPR